MPADLVIRNVVPFRRGRFGREPASVVVRGGRIAAIRRYCADERAGSSAVVLEGRGGALIPGLVDAHLHLIETALSRLWLDLRGAGSIEELKELVARRAEEVPRGTWILGRGWDQDKFRERRYPYAKDLDEAAPENPVLLIRICGHVAVANSLALEIAGISARTPDPPGGAIERDEMGNPTGLLKESAVELARRAVPRPGVGELRELVEEAISEFLSKGLTMIHVVSAKAEELGILQALKREGKLKVRIRAYVDPSALELASELEGDEHLRIAGIKLIADGSLGARTAALREPYSDRPEEGGSLLLDREALRRYLSIARKRELQVAIHCIGDRALEEVLEAVLEEGFPGDLLRIEHCSLAPPDLVEMLASVKPVVVVQPRFVISDWWILDRLGRKRARWAYCFKSLLESGLVLAGSSDSPVEPWDPWEGMRSAVERGAGEFARMTSDERLSVEEAIEMYTRGGAIACGEEEDYGEVEEGRVADLVLLDRIPERAEDLEELEVVAVIVGGELVYCSRPDILVG